MDSEFRKCQKFISEHSHLSATESAHLVKVYTDDDPDFEYGLTFKAFIKHLYELERDWTSGDWIIPLEVYQEHGFGVEDDEEVAVVHLRGCDLPHMKEAINNQFFFHEETYRIKTW